MSCGSEFPIPLGDMLLNLFFANFLPVLSWIGILLINIS